MTELSGTVDRIVTAFPPIQRPALGKLAAMTVHVGSYEFDHVDYDKDGDVLYLRTGSAQPAADTFATPEGHAVRLDEHGEVIGITIVNAKWLLETRRWTQSHRAEPNGHRSSRPR